MTDVIELLKRADPADREQLRAKDPPRATLNAILANPRPADGSVAVPRRHRRARLLAPAAALAAALIAVVLVLPGGGGRGVQSAAAAALERIADIARAQPPTLPPGDSRFLYFRLESKGFLAMGPEPPFHRGIRTRDDFGFLLDFRTTQEVWVGEHRGLVRNAGAAPTFASPRDRRAWEEAGRPKLPPAHDDTTPTNSGIERLRIPTDPSALLDHLRERAESEDHGNAWIFGTLLTDYLREWGITPEQRAALYEAAARLPGVDLLGPRRDPAGRRGVGFAMNDGEEHMRHTLIVDPDTGELLAQTSQTLPGGPIPPGATTSTVFHSPVLVGHQGERP
jgi:hypothetical protein